MPQSEPRGQGAFTPAQEGQGARQPPREVAALVYAECYLGREELARLLTRARALREARSASTVARRWAERPRRRRRPACGGPP